MFLSSENERLYTKEAAKQKKKRNERGHEQISKALRLAAAGQYKIIYVAPERLESHDFLAFTERVDISMLTIDEAHCISQWGQDFRPSYLKIVQFIKQLKTRPIVSAFTATATERVKEDIVCALGLCNPQVLITGFDRKNLYFAVETPKKKRHLCQKLHKGTSFGKRHHLLRHQKKCGYAL